MPDVDKNVSDFNVDKFKELYATLKKEDADQTFKGLDYISWATAWKTLMLSDATANYEVIEKPDGGIVWEEFGTLLVKTKVVAFGKTIKMHLPLMDANHNPVKLEAYQINGRPIPALNSRIVNDNIMRCLAKNIAMFGIGLALYVKEDLPSEEKEAADKSEAAVKETKKAVVCSDCGKEISSDGKLSAAQVAAGTAKAYGVPLCGDCGRKRKEQA